MNAGMTSTIVAALAAVIAAAPQNVRAQDTPREGMWRAWLDSPGGPLPFQMELRTSGVGGYDALVHNGAESAQLTGASIVENRLVIKIDHYDATITAGISDAGTRLDGVWEKQSKGKKTSKLPFHAVFGAAPRFDKPPSWNAPGKSIGGKWSAEFASDKNPAVGLFEQSDGGTVTGTFMTATGDYRYLEGDFDEEQLRLSVFDGAHAFLFTAKLSDDETLLGDFWSGETWHEKWTAKRDPNASLRDPFRMNRTISHVKMDGLTFRDLDGTSRTLSDPQYHNKLILLEVFGSWCPNCHDAAEFMVELDRRYGDIGLTIVGLAYELTGDFERDARQVERFKKRHDIEYPLLIAGTSDKDVASSTLPFLDKVISYPTIVLLDDEFRIKAVHTGFSGPATGEAYDSFKKKMHDLIGDVLLRPKDPWEK